MTTAVAATQSSVGRRIRLIVSVVMMLHAVLHLLAPADIWGWVELDENITPSLEIGATAEGVLAYAWIGAAVVLLAAAVVLIRRRTSWRWLALGGVVVSQALIVIWWTAASAGTVANLIIVGGLVYDAKVGLAAPAPATEPFGPCCEGWEEPAS